MRASWAPAAPAMSPELSVQSPEPSDGSRQRANSRLWTLSSRLISDQREIRTPTPQGHDVLSVACLPFHHLAELKVGSEGIEPLVTTSLVLRQRFYRPP